MAQERLIEASGNPYTIVRATQFFEFLGGIAQGSTEGQVVRLPSALMQPMSADDVAAELSNFVLGPPLNRIAEIAGPEPLGIDEAVGRYLAATGDARRVITDANAPYYGIKVTERSLMPDNAARLGSTTWTTGLPNSRMPARSLSELQRLNSLSLNVDKELSS
jgi:uncharacterized protein YbjT (DUF2867 family)